MTERFVGLHSHTAGSTLDAIIKVPDLFRRVKELGQDAISVTDHGTMQMVWTAFKEYKKYRDAGTPIKLIVGNEIYFCEDLTDKKSKRRHLVLLASNEAGYRNLLRVTAAGFDNSVNVMGREFPRVDAEILRKYSDGLFATSACGGSLLAAGIFGGNRDAAKKAAELFRGIYGDRFFIELQPHSLRRGEFSQEFLNEQLKSIAEELGIEMVATCDSHYLTAAHEKYHDMVLAISDKKPLDDPDRHRYTTFEPCIVCGGSGQSPIDDSDICAECLGEKGRQKPCAEFYLKSEQQIFSFFNKRYGAQFANQLIDNTRKIADACEMPDYMEPKSVHLPTFGWRFIDQADDAEEFRKWLGSKASMQKIAVDWAYLRFKAWKAFGEYTEGFSKEDKRRYWDRILFEIEILEARNFCSYMLIVSDFMTWARNNDVEVGPGRGSAAASLLGLFLKIHDVDPLKYNLFFERFQNRERKQFPDIDLDLSHKHRERVIDYVAEKYGRDCVAHISNVNTITPKIAVKDIARSLNLGGDKSTAFKLANDVTATIPDKVTVEVNGVEKIVKVDNMELALRHSKELQIFVQEYPEVLEYANEIVGLPRAAGVHAAGIIISDVPLNAHVPLRRDKDGRQIVQWDKDQCEEAGFVKFDFLGLDTLDVLRDTYEMMKGIGCSIPEPAQIPEGDENAFRLIQSGKVVGIFQLEGGTLAPLCKSFRPDTISEIADLSALGRPGCSKEERQDYIARKSGKQKVEFQHPLLTEILRHTYGIKMYDEDLLRIGQQIAGWPLSKADVLRKITKLKEKGAALVAKTQNEFVQDVIKHSKLSKEEAEMLWRDVVEPFSKYGFCCAHSTAYGILGYRTAYYKYHAPAAFLAAKLNAETQKASGSEDEIEIIKKDAKSFGIKITPCDVNVSKKYYTIRDKKTIVTGFSAIKGLGEKALEALMAHQPYSSFLDFLHRTPSSAVNKSTITAMAKAGAFDSLGVSRKFAHDHYASIRKEFLAYLKKIPDEKFSIDPETNRADKTKAPTDVMAGFTYSKQSEDKNEWDIRAKMMGEKEVLGEYVSGSIDLLFPGFYKQGIWAIPFSRLQKMPEKQQFYLEGLIVSINERPHKSGKNQGKLYARMVVENLKGETVEMTIWADMWTKLKRVMKNGYPFRALTKVGDWNGTKTLSLVHLEEVWRPEPKREEAA